MTHPLRHLMRIVELQDTLSGGAPPPIDIERDPSRRPEGGQYWFNRDKTVAVPRQGDFGILPMSHYRAFGFDPQHMLAWFAQHNKIANDELQRHLRDPSARIFGSSGARSGSIMYAYSQGWGFIEFDEQSATIWLQESDAGRVIHNAGNLFPLMNMELIQVLLAKNEPFKNQVLIFRKEDHPGFAGAYGALMQWAKDGTVPEQNWVYTVAEPEQLQPDGLRGKPVPFVHKGGWTDRNVFAIQRIRRRGPLGAMDTGVYRFPRSVAVDLDMDEGDILLGQSVLYTKQPFVIPANMLQRKTVAGWAPV